eukprot:5582623-Alexandrium_andersonii.AAC.1
MLVSWTPTRPLLSAAQRSPSSNFKRRALPGGPAPCPWTPHREATVPGPPQQAPPSDVLRWA